MNKCSVYWIHLPEHTDMFSQGYIGITNREVQDRYKQHIYMSKIGSEFIVHKAINKYIDKVVISTVLIGSREYCLDVESKLRPNEYIGWNIAAGGGAATVNPGRPTTQESKDKLSVALKNHWEGNDEAKAFISAVHLGRKRSVETRENISKSLKGKSFTEDRKLKLSQSRTGATKWTSNRADKALWAKADILYEYFVSNPGVGVDNMSKYFNINKYSLVNIHKYFRQGWNPKEDSQWQQFKEQYKDSK